MNKASAVASADIDEYASDTLIVDLSAFEDEASMSISVTVG